MRLLAACLAIALSAGVGFAPPAAADHESGNTYFAMEVFAPEGAPDTDAACGQSTSIEGMASPDQLPAETTASVTVQGPFAGATGTSQCSVWMVGGTPVSVEFGPTPPPLGREVRMVGAAEVADPTTIVAERFVDREDPAVGEGEVELAYYAEFILVDGDIVIPAPVVGCLTVPQDVWTVEDAAGHRHQLDVSAARAAGEIEPCTGVDPLDPAPVAVAAEFGLEPAAD